MDVSLSHSFAIIGAMKRFEIPAPAGDFVGQTGVELVVGELRRDDETPTVGEKGFRVAFKSPVAASETRPSSSKAGSKVTFEPNGVSTRHQIGCCVSHVERRLCATTDTHHTKRRIRA